MEKGKDILKKYLPLNAVEATYQIFEENDNLFLKISKSRNTKLGDYRMLPGNKHQISINYNLNPYQFLLTLLHEIAHFYTYREFGRRVKPHGKEWKMFFGKLIIEFIDLKSFPSELIDDLKNYAQNPRATTGGDGKLFIKISSYDEEVNKDMKFVFELAPGSYFAFENGESFRLQEKRRTRYKCLNLKNNKTYLVHQNARVFPLKNIEYEK
jgi:hypothetical protein